MMFRIAFMVDEKDVGTVYSRLDGVKLYEVEPPQKVKPADDRPYTELVDLAGRKTITSKEVKDAIVAAGRKPTAITYALSQMVEYGLIRSTGKRGVYNVVKRSGGK